LSTRHAKADVDPPESGHPFQNSVLKRIFFDQPASTWSENAPQSGVGSSVGPGPAITNSARSLPDVFAHKVQPRAFSSEVDTGSREENAKRQKVGAARLMQSGRILL
jgi:hypothetical protein